MRLTPFDSFKVMWLNSHIFYELCGCRDIGMQVGNHGYEWRQEERGSNSLLNWTQDNHNFIKLGKWGLDLVEGSS